MSNIRSEDVRKYKGMWKKQPGPLSKMRKEELIKHLKSFRNAWERITDRNMDLSDERLKSEKIGELRSMLDYYYSDYSRKQASEWLGLTDSEREDNYYGSDYSDSSYDMSRSSSQSPIPYRKRRVQRRNSPDSPSPKHGNNPGNNPGNSPEYQAKDFKNRRKKGGDGEWYRSDSDRNGVYRWRKIRK